VHEGDGVIEMANRRAQRNTAAAEPTAPTVLVQWLRTTSDAAHEGGGHIGNRRYTGRAGEQVQIREDDAQILAGGGYVKYVVEPEQA
jgi:hypothetical protein